MQHAVQVVLNLSRVASERKYERTQPILRQSLLDSIENLGELLGARISYSDREIVKPL